MQAAPTHALSDSIGRAGRVAWAIVGMLVVLAVAGFVVSKVALVVIPLVIALFPAAILLPLHERLRRLRLPGAAAALLTILIAIGVLVGVTTLLIPVVSAQLPELTEAVQVAAADLEALIASGPFGLDVPDLDTLLAQAREQFGAASQQLVGPALEAAGIAVEVVAGLLFGLAALFFYLKDGRRIAGALRDLMPRRWRPPADELGPRVWRAISGYVRGQLLIALADAVVIGIGLVVLRVPLALPLTVVVFVGGLFPIVGAFVSGLVAVLVGLAAGGVTTALLVLALVVAVQQLEGDVLAPIVFGSTVALHPLVVLVALTAGAVAFGLLGAFLAVPVAAALARVVDYTKEQLA